MWSTGSASTSPIGRRTPARSFASAPCGTKRPPKGAPPRAGVSTSSRLDVMARDFRIGRKVQRPDEHARRHHGPSPTAPRSCGPSRYAPRELTRPGGGRVGFHAVRGREARLERAADAWAFSGRPEVWKKACGLAPRHSSVGSDSTSTRAFVRVTAVLSKLATRRAKASTTAPLSLGNHAVDAPSGPARAGVSTRRRWAQVRTVRATWCGVRSGRADREKSATDGVRWRCFAVPPRVCRGPGRPGGPGSGGGRRRDWWATPVPDGRGPHR